MKKHTGFLRGRRFGRGRTFFGGKCVSLQGMDEKEKNRIIWKEASERGALLGGLSVLCLGLKQLASTSGVELLVSGGGIILWLVEFFGCILILRDAMRRRVEADPEATGRDTYLLGRRMCIFSSFILATAVVCLVLYVPDNIFTAAFAQATEAYSSVLGAEAKTALGEMDITDTPGVLFFSQFLYAWLYGCIVSSILARNIPRDPRVQEMLDELDRRMGKKSDDAGNNPPDEQ